jgi:hypothetical protein
MIVTTSINIDLSVAVSNDILTANLVFENKSFEGVYLDTWLVFSKNKIRNNFFNITNSKGEKVKYIGMMAHRFFEKENFIELQPGAAVTADVVLSDVYRLEKGEAYSITYHTFHPVSLDSNKLMILQSNTVEITY